MKFKRSLIFLLVFSLLTTVLSVLASAMPGDIDGNGEITSLDYMMLKRHVLDTYEIDDELLADADVNADGSVDAQDYMMLKRHVLGTYTIGEKPSDPAYTNVARGKSYTRTVLYPNNSNPSYPDEGGMSMTDGEISPDDARYGNTTFAGFNKNSDDYKAKGYAHITVDLGENHLLDQFTAYIGSVGLGAGIDAPEVIWAYLSADGETWYNAGALDFSDTDKVNTLEATLKLDSALSATYVQFRFLGNGNWIFVSEVEAYGIPSETVTPYPESKDQKSFLFVGNSATYYFNIPLKLMYIAESAGVDIDVEVCCVGSAYLEYFADETSTTHGIPFREHLAKKNFDYVVLQDNSNTTYERSKAAIDILKPLIDANGAEMLLYKRYSSNDDPAQRLDSAYRHEVNYTKLAETFGVKMVAPGADAFLICTERYPEINLYYTDNSHHGEKEGAYLLACTMAVEFLGIDLDEVTYTGGLDEATVKALKECATLACTEGYDYPQDN